jgi:hypothetical protein
MRMEGDFKLSLSIKLLYQHVLHEMLQEKIERGHHRTVEWIQAETYGWENEQSPSAGHELWRPFLWRRM